MSSNRQAWAAAIRKESERVFFASLLRFWGWAQAMRELKRAGWPVVIRFPKG